MLWTVIDVGAVVTSQEHQMAVTEDNQLKNIEFRPLGHNKAILK